MKVLPAAIAAVSLGLGLAAALYWSFSSPEGAAKSALPFSRDVRPKAVPAIQIQDASGRVRSLEDFRGRTVLLNLWATWCAPCREEMPALDRLQAKLGGPRFEVVALSIDQQGLRAARKFFDDVGIKALALYVDPSAKAAFTLGAVGVPSTLLIDVDGREIGRHAGPAQWDSAEVAGVLSRRIPGEQR